MAELTASTPLALQPDERWKATARHQADKARAGLSYEGWSSGGPQQPGMWFQGELPSPRRVAEIAFDGVQWRAPVAEGQGSGTTTTIAFAPVSAKFLRLSQTSHDSVQAPWAIQRLRVFAAPQ